MIEFHSAILRGSCVPLDRPPALWMLIHLEMGGMPLHVGVGINYKTGTTTEVKAQEPGLWAKGYIVGDCASVIGLDMTASP